MKPKSTAAILRNAMAGIISSDQKECLDYGPNTTPKPIKALEPMPEPARHDAERIRAAKEKRARKLARYTDTPQARAQRAKTEADPRFVPFTHPAPVHEDCP